MEHAWVVDIRDQCRKAGVPFFFKQWGHWKNNPLGRNGKAYVEEHDTHDKGGALLDGEIFLEYPQVPAITGTPLSEAFPSQFRSQRPQTEEGKGTSEELNARPLTAAHAHGGLQTNEIREDAVADTGKTVANEPAVVTQWGFAKKAYDEFIASDETRNRNLYALLAEMMKLMEQARADVAAFNGFLRENGITGKPKPDYKDIVKLLWGKNSRGYKSALRYATLLDGAEVAGEGATTIAEWVEMKGGIEDALVLVRGGVPHDSGEIDPTVVATMRKQLGSLAPISALPQAPEGIPDGYSVAVLRRDGTTAEIVRVLDKDVGYSQDAINKIIVSVGDKTRKAALGYDQYTEFARLSSNFAGDVIVLRNNREENRCDCVVTGVVRHRETKTGKTIYPENNRPTFFLTGPALPIFSDDVYVFASKGKSKLSEANEKLPKMLFAPFFEKLIAPSTVDIKFDAGKIDTFTQTVEDKRSRKATIKLTRSDDIKGIGNVFWVPNDNDKVGSFTWEGDSFDLFTIGAKDCVPPKAPGKIEIERFVGLAANSEKGQIPFKGRPFALLYVENGTLNLAREGYSPSNDSKEHLKGRLAPVPEGVAPAGDGVDARLFVDVCSTGTVTGDKATFRISVANLGKIEKLITLGDGVKAKADFTVYSNMLSVEVSGKHGVSVRAFFPLVVNRDTKGGANRMGPSKDAFGTTSVEGLFL